MFSKILIFVLVNLYLCSANSYVDCPNNDVTTLIADRTYYQRAMPLQTHTEVVDVPNNGLADNAISCILIHDLSSDGEGELPLILQGGIGYKFVQIKLASRHGKELNFRVEVYTGKSSATTAAPSIE